MVGVIIATLRLIDPQRRRRLGLIALLALVVSVFEVVSAFLVLVILGLVLNPDLDQDMPIVGDPTRFTPDLDHVELVVYAAVIFGAFSILRGAVYLYQQYVVARTAEHTGIALARRLVQGYLSMPYRFHLQRNSAELVRNAYDNIQVLIRQVFRPMSILVAETLLTISMLAVLTVVAPLAAALIAMAMGTVLAITYKLVQPRLRRQGRLRQGAAHVVLEQLQQGFSGVRDIKVLGRADVFTDSFVQARNQLGRAEYLKEVLLAAPRVSLETSFLLLVMLAAVIAVIQDLVTDLLPTVGVFAYAGLRLQPSLQKLAGGLNDLRFSQAIVNDLEADLASIEEATSKTRADAEATTRLELTRAVRFEDVSFEYEGTTAAAIKDLDVTIEHGMSVGVCGPSGGGKTTFLDLLCGLLTPTTGRITVDNVDIASATSSWQRTLGVVHQTSFLIDDTVRRNIALGVPDVEIDDERLQHVLAISQLEEVVRELPNGLDTVVGERGVRISGGQRQRLTLARALYREPSLLILDEGTSALDTATEARVMTGLASLGDDLTTVMVAHRLSTIESCDMILFLDDGRLAATGTFHGLMESDPSFLAFVRGWSRETTEDT